VIQSIAEAAERPPTSTVITNLLYGFVTLSLMEHNHLSAQAYFKTFGGQAWSQGREIRNTSGRNFRKLLCSKIQDWSQTGDSMIPCARQPIILGTPILNSCICVSKNHGKNKSSLLNRGYTCANFGIHVATCVTCHEKYVGQTSINVHWDGHCNAVATWNELDNAGDIDQMALLWHYSKCLDTVNKPPLHKSYIVICKAA